MQHKVTCKHLRLLSADRCYLHLSMAMSRNVRLSLFSVTSLPIVSSRSIALGLFVIAASCRGVFYKFIKFYCTKRVETRLYMQVRS